MSFHVGQKVVCVDDKWFHSVHDVTTMSLPRKGLVYLCAGYDNFREPGSRTDCLYIYLDGFGVLLFSDDHFRPITERKTDISIFRRLLTPSDRKKIKEKA